MSKGVYQPLLTDADKSNVQSAEDKASTISKLFIFFLNDLFKLGTEKELVLEDLGVPCKNVCVVLLICSFLYFFLFYFFLSVFRIDLAMCTTSSSFIGMLRWKRKSWVRNGNLYGMFYG